MSIELHKFDNLGRKEELVFVLFTALNTEGAVERNHFIRFCGSNIFSLNLSIHAILYLLEFMNFIEYENGKIQANRRVFDYKKFDQTLYFETPHFFRVLFESLESAGILNLLLSKRNIQFDRGNSIYYLKNHLIPFKLHSIRNLLLALGFLEMSDKTDQLVVSKLFTDFFEDLIKRVNYKKKQTKKDLEKSLKLRESLGIEAEEFVLKYEIIRLKNHPFADRIKRISDDDVSAGYDIESFSDFSSVFPNRFIEVKSYSESISFFWSRNEVEKAKSLRDEYYLYLVDRSKLAEKDYKPKILQDPWSKIMKSDYWLKDTESWKIEYSGL